jgi:DNA-directed RNA polymerase specialized sigma24 family protein
VSVPRAGVLKLPPTVSEADFIRMTSHVARVLFPRFGSIHGSADDFAQTVVVWSLEALPKYDASRSLDAFLFTVARSRAMNAIRDTVRRNDPPCAACHAGTPCGPDGARCERYARWLERNEAKANLARPVALSEVSDSCERSAHGSPTAESVAEGRELTDLIDRGIPLSLRADYLRMAAGESVPKARRERVRQAVRDILENPARYAAQPEAPSGGGPAADAWFDPDDEDD